jgi:integral membrane sensor domain MASE1
MFFLLAIYAIAMPLLLSQTKQQEQVSVLVGLPTVFIVIFFVLTLVYVIQKRSR